MENLKFGNEASTDEEVMALTKQLNLHNIIIQLPDQYN